MSAKGSVPAGKTRALSSSAAVAPIARRSNGQHTVVADLRAPSQLDVGRTCNSSRDTFRLIIIARNERAGSCGPRWRPVIEPRRPAVATLDADSPSSRRGNQQQGVFREQYYKSLRKRKEQM